MQCVVGVAFFWWSTPRTSGPGRRNKESPLTVPMVSMHDHINACSLYQSKKQRKNPNLAFKDKQTTKQRTKDLESIRKGQSISI